MKRPPLLLTLVAAAYMAYLVWQLISNFTPTIAGRAAIAALLLFFVFRGSRIASNIMAVLSVISALMLLVTAIGTLSTNFLASVLLVVASSLLLSFAFYLVFSRSIREFQAVRPSATST